MEAHKQHLPKTKLKAETILQWFINLFGECVITDLFEKTVKMMGFSFQKNVHSSSRFCMLSQGSIYFPEAHPYAPLKFRTSGAEGQCPAGHKHLKGKQLT
jgi:hypothetical protein